MSEYHAIRPGDRWKSATEAGTIRQDEGDLIEVTVGPVRVKIPRARFLQTWRPVRPLQTLFDQEDQ